MLRLRLITGPILVATLVALLWLDEWFDGRLAAHWATGNGVADGAEHGAAPRAVLLTCFMALIVAPLGAVELCRLLRASSLNVPTALGAVAASVTALSACALFMAPSTPTIDALLPSALAAILAVAFIVLARHRSIEGVVGGMSGSLFVAVYLGLLPAFYVAIRQEWSGWVVIGLVLTIKSSDIGAYATGRLVGRHKLIPWLSPGKTVEGFAGGIGLAALVGLLLALWSGAGGSTHRVPPWLGLVGGAILAVVGQFGDLAESLIKRSAGAKDSGNTLPGMGGILDVIDSLLFAGPVAWWLLRLATA